MWEMPTIENILSELFLNFWPTNIEQNKNLSHYVLWEFITQTITLGVDPRNLYFNNYT